MADRLDPSQHPVASAAEVAEYPAVSYETGGTDDAGLISPPSWPNPRTLADTLVVPIPLDVLDTHLDQFFTAFTKAMRPVARPVVLSQAGGVIPNIGIGEVAGINLAEIGGANPVVVTLYDGPDANGIPIFRKVLQSGTDFLSNFPHDGLHFERGLFYTVTGVQSNVNAGVAPVYGAQGILFGAIYMNYVRPV